MAWDRLNGNTVKANDASNGSTLFKPNNIYRLKSLDKNCVRQPTYEVVNECMNNNAGEEHQKGYSMIVKNLPAVRCRKTTFGMFLTDFMPDSPIKSANVEDATFKHDDISDNTIAFENTSEVDNIRQFYTEIIGSKKDLNRLAAKNDFMMAAEGFNPNKQRSRNRGTRKNPMKAIECEIEDYLDLRLHTVESNDDYCYYDSKTDGFYYQRKGYRGWRKRVCHSTEQQAQKDLREFYKPYLTMAGDGNNCAVPTRRYYDAASDGYYFEMPAVDGWKRRRPIVQGKPSTSSVEAKDRVVQNVDEKTSAHCLSYGAALARGQLPPAHSLQSNGFADQNSRPKGSSAGSTRSSVSDGATIAINERAFVDSDPNMFYPIEYLDCLIAKYNSMNISQAANEETCDQLSDSEAGYKKTNSCEVEDVENKPPHENEQLKRPESLNCVTSDSSNHKILTNFNAERFIADLNFNNLHDEHVLRNLSSLRSPINMTSTAHDNSPQTSNADFTDFSHLSLSSGSNWASINPCTLWSPKDYSSQNDLVKIDERNSYAEANDKSKLSLWAGHLTAVPCNNF